MRLADREPHAYLAMNPFTVESLIGSDGCKAAAIALPVESFAQ